MEFVAQNDQTKIRKAQIEIRKSQINEFTKFNQANSQNMYSL